MIIKNYPGASVLTVAASSWDPETSTAASPPRSGCPAAGRQPSWSWRGWTPRLRETAPPWFSPSAHKQRESNGRGLRILSCIGHIIYIDLIYDRFLFCGELG